MPNPWTDMTCTDGRAMDERKESGPVRHQVALKRELIWRMIEPRLPKDATTAVLDLGGGTGVWAIRVAQAGHPVILTDISPGLLARARDKVAAADLAGLVRIEEADICDLSRYPEDAFPLVLALGDPLSYCADADHALCEIHRVTAPGGILIGDVENRYRAALSTRRASTWEGAKRILGEGIAHWPEPDNPAPIREFAPAELRETLEKSGWRVEGMWPADLLESLISEGILREALQDEACFREALSLEASLRDEPSLLGSGSELQFVAVK
jgi:SAM-dependent methyltransferase